MMKEQEQSREEDADAQEQRGDTLGAESFADRGSASMKKGGAVAGCRTRAASSLLCVTGLAHGDRIWWHRSLWL